MKVSKKRYIQLFGFIVIILALVRCAFPRIAQPRLSSEVPEANEKSDSTASDSTAIVSSLPNKDYIVSQTEIHISPSLLGRQGESLPPHRIFSVPRYDQAFPDSQNVQIVSAEQWGVSPVQNRQDAERRKSELTYIGASPYYCVEKLKNSIPYVVPRASVLLNDIGRAFFDSLYVKGIPLHKFVITSVLRTKDDVSHLQTFNHNATEKSCHMYGTTIDISQNRYKTVQTLGHPRRQVRNDSLKWVLAEVLRDYRKAGRCYVKYEVFQGCFHITVR